MEDERPTTADLLEAWRETTRAAELAERLAQLALDAAEQADADAVAYEQIADMAETASAAALRAAENARTVATEARGRATQTRDVRLRDADQSLVDARADEDSARDKYHDREATVRETITGL